MKDFFKKFTKPQTEVEDLDSGYDSEYYAGSYDKEERVSDENRSEDSRFKNNDYYAPRGGLYVEQDAPAYRERPEERVEPVFTPEPAPEYLYFTPATYRDCREGIVKGLAAGHVVVVRLGDLEATDVLRLFDYMMGAVLALEAELVRPEATTVVLVPAGVELDEDELELDDEDEYEDEYEDDEEYEDEYEEDEEYEEEYDEEEEYEEDEAYEEYDETEEYEDVEVDAE